MGTGLPVIMLLLQKFLSTVQLCKANPR